MTTTETPPTVHPDKLPDVPLYAIGFYMDEEARLVGLIRRRKPNAPDVLQGIGGVMLPTENSCQAQRRLFAEVTGLRTSEEDWLPFALLTASKTQFDKGHHTTALVMRGSIENLRNREAEHIAVINVNGMTASAPNIAPNVRFLIPLALNFLEHGRPRFTYQTRIEY